MPVRAAAFCSMTARLFSRANFRTAARSLSDAPYWSANSSSVTCLLQSGCAFARSTIVASSRSDPGVSHGALRPPTARAHSRVRDIYALRYYPRYDLAKANNQALLRGKALQKSLCSITIRRARPKRPPRETYSRRLDLDAGDGLSARTTVTAKGLAGYMTTRTHLAFCFLRQQ